MRMGDGKKFYWLKLKRDFFKRHDIRIIEEMPNGKDYILFYLKLLLESVDHEGTLRFSDTIPYNEQMLSVVTNTNIDIVRSAMKLFVELHMMDIFDDKTIYMSEVEKYIGSETQWAEKKRLQRAKGDNVPLVSSNCPTELEKELESEKETEKESFTTTTTTDEPMMTEVYVYFKSLLVDNASKEAEKFHAYNANKGWSCLPDWKATADLWIARIDEKGRA
jgi:predicted phage replisome organizer